MSEEFKKTGLNIVTSTNGFTMEVKVAGGVVYRDNTGEYFISSEWLVEPPKLGIILYKMEQSHIDNIFSNVKRALEYLGHRVEIWSSPSG